MVKDVIMRRISPLKKRVPPMWNYWGKEDPTRDYKDDLPQAEIDARIRLVCEKSPFSIAASQILAVLTAEAKWSA